MIKKTITYTDFNGNSRTEDFHFNFTKAEAAELELTTPGGLGETINAIIATNDTAKMIIIFKDLILKAYGQKSVDGKRFIKRAEDGHRLADDFAETEAYSELFMELATNDKAAAEFINGIIPQDKPNVPAPSIK